VNDGAEGVGASMSRGWVRWLGAGGALAVWLTMTAPAAAHPHIWIEHWVTLIGGSRGIEGVRFTWEFDPLFSSLIFQEFDTDRNKQFSPAEVQAIEHKHLGNLKSYDYFVQIKVQGAPVPISVKDFQALVGSNGQVTYAFTVPVSVPGAEGSVEILVFDPTIFTAFALRPKSPFVVQLARPYTAECKVSTDTSGFSGEALRCSYRRGTG
jgi:ABC-type uncharacterized transport system substrate-binding protein